MDKDRAQAGVRQRAVPLLLWHHRMRMFGGGDNVYVENVDVTTRVGRAHWDNGTSEKVTSHVSQTSAPLLILIQGCNAL